MADSARGHHDGQSTLECFKPKHESNISIFSKVEGESERADWTLEGIPREVLGPDGDNGSFLDPVSAEAVANN